MNKMKQDKDNVATFIEIQVILSKNKQENI